MPAWRAIFYRPRKKVYLFLPINGAGLGHLTRLLAVARRLQHKEPDAEIVFLTTSIGVTLVHRAGFTCHHVTPAALLNASPTSWNKLFFQSLENVFNVHKPATLVFDGTIPYLGLLRVMHSYRRINYVWIKRGLYKNQVDENRLRHLARGFKTIISPGELASEKDLAMNDARFHSVGPISLLDKSDLLPSATARQQLRLDPVKPCAYVQLGAGNINGISDVQDRIIALLKRKGIQVVLGQSPIALDPKPDLRGDSVIVDYPNSKFFAGFDFAVLAGGYNSVCEAVMLGLPAIFLPNTETGADDQVKRVQQARAFGPYEVVTDYKDEEFEKIVDKLLAHDQVVKGIEQKNGAVSAASLIACN